MYEQRSYRKLHNSELTGFQVQYEACDLWLAVTKSADSETLRRECQSFIQSQWQELYAYISSDRAFASALSPYYPRRDAPLSAKQMAAAAAKAAVGPMAAVAGCFAAQLGLYLTQKFQLTDLLIENGGDLWLRSSKPRTIALYAGTSSLSGKIGLQIPATEALGICTSSGTVGHSLSFGQADAVTVVAADAALADAFATAIANRIAEPANIQTELDALHPELDGCVIVLASQLGVKGKIKLVNL